MRKIEKIIVHWSANVNSTCSSIRSYHKNVRGYKDIGYHYVIERNAVVKIGRSIDQVGAHCKGYNVGSVGVCVVADPDNPPTPFQISSLQSLIVDLIINFDLDWSDVWCHSDFAKTECPGELLRQFVHYPFKFEYD